MKAAAAFLAAALIFAGWLSAAPFDEEKPHGRICLAVLDTAHEEKQEALRSTSTPGPGKKINVYLDASEKCVAFVVALRKDGKLANDWKPQWADLEEDMEAQMPNRPVVWEWSKQGEAFDFHFYFVSPGTKEIADLKKLITAMQNPKPEAQVLALQTNKLRELLGRVAAEKDRSHQVVTADPEVGGVFRGPAFPWRQFARGANFAADRPGVIIVPCGQNGSSDAGAKLP